MLQLAEDTGTFIPLAPYILQPLSNAEVSVGKATRP
jgi:hypothetical protein